MAVVNTDITLKRWVVGLIFVVLLTCAAVMTYFNGW